MYIEGSSIQYRKKCTYTCSTPHPFPREWSWRLCLTHTPWEHAHIPACLPGYPTSSVGTHIYHGTMSWSAIIYRYLGTRGATCMLRRSNPVHPSTLKRGEYLEMCAAGWDLFRFEWPETLGSLGALLSKGCSA